jgi:putative ABC transport system permease protein
VRDVKLAGLEAPSEPAYYLPASQAPLQDMTLLVRTTTDPLSLVGAVRGAVLSIDPNQPISNVSTLEKVVDESVAQRRLNMLLMGLFGALAMSAVGGRDLRVAVARCRATHAGDGNSHGARRAGE